MGLGTFQNFGNNLLLEKIDYRLAGNFTDENKLFNLFNGKDGLSRTYLGTLALFNQMSLISTPLMNLTASSANTIYVNGDDGEFTFDVPYTLEMPTVKQDLTHGIDKVGVDGQTFSLIIGDGNLDPIFGLNHIITSDLRDGQQFIVVGVGGKVGDGFEYQLKLVTNDRAEYVDKRQLAVGTQYMMVGSAIGTYDEVAPGVNMSAGKMRMLHRLGAKRAVEMTITGSAQRLKLESSVGTDKNFMNTVAPFLDPKNPEFLLAMGYNNGQGKIDTAKGVNIVPMFEVMLLKELMLQGERQLMYGNAGQIQDQRNRFKITSPGLYQQMKAGNWLKIPKYSIDTIKGIFSQVFRNRPDIADVDRKLHFMCGRGAVTELTRICTELGIQIVNALGVVLNNDGLKIVNGDRMNLSAGYRFNKAFLPGFGWLSFEHNPALDSEFNRYMDEPRIGGLPKFSYTSMILDVTDTMSTNAFTPSKDVKFATGYDSGKNIYTIKNEGMPGIKYSYLNGRTSPYPISTGKGQVVSTMFDGYKCFLEEQSSIWLRDPGRSILLQLA